MIKICPYCNLDTGGNHEWGCPNYGPDYVEHDMRLAAQPISTRKMRLVNPEYLKQLKTERDELANRAEELQSLLAEALEYIQDPDDYSPIDRIGLENKIEEVLHGH